MDAFPATTVTPSSLLAAIGASKGLIWKDIGWVMRTEAKAAKACEYLQERQPAMAGALSASLNG
jgi:hypothetical protein